MAWFNKIYSWVTDFNQGIGTRADRHDAQDNAFVNGICAAWLVNPTANGQNPAFNGGVSSTPTVNVNMGGYRMTNAANGVSAQDFATVSQLTGGADSPVWGGVAGGTANVVTITLSPALAAYANGIYILFVVGTTNTGNVTVNVNGLGAISVLKNGSKQLEAGDWVAGTTQEIVYYNGNFQLVSNVNGLVTQTGASLYCTATGTANALLATLSPVPGFTSYPDGFTLRVRAAADNTGNVTLNVNGIGAVSVTWFGQNLNAGWIKNGNIYELTYSVAATTFQITSWYGVPITRDGSSIFGVSTGTANALLVAFDPVLTTNDLIPGLTLRVKANITNTGATTINFGAGVLNIVKFGNVALVAGDLQANVIYEFSYDGTNMQLVNNFTTVSTAGLATGGPFQGSGTVTVTQATKSQQIAGTSQTVAVTPYNQQNHWSAAKCMIVFSASGGVINNAPNGYNNNGATVVRNSAGVYTVTFSIPFTTAYYYPYISANITSGSGTLGIQTPANTPPLATSYTFGTYNIGTGISQDADIISCIFFGTQ